MAEPAVQNQRGVFIRRVFAPALVLVVALGIVSGSIAPTVPTATADGCAGTAPAVDQSGLWIVRGERAARVWANRTHELRWSPDGRFLAARVEVGEHQWAIDVLDASELAPLTSVLDGAGLGPVAVRRVARSSGPVMPMWSADNRLVWNEDGHVLMYEPLLRRTRTVHRGVGTAGGSHALVDDHPRLLLVDLTTLEAREIPRPDVQMLTPLVLSADDRRVVYGDFRSWGLPDGVDSEWKLYALDLASGRTNALGDATTIDVSLVGERLVELNDFEHENGWRLRTIQTRSLEGQETTVISNAAWALGGVTDAGLLVFHDHDEQAIVAADTNGSVRRRVAVDASHAGAAGSTISFVQATSSPSDGADRPIPLIPIGCASTAGRAPRRVVQSVFEDDHLTHIVGLAPSPDDKTFAVSTVRTYSPPPSWWSPSG